MSDIAIRVEGLSKQYRIGGKHERYRTLRDTLTNAFAAPARRLASVVRGQSTAVSNETIWALKDVSFEVQQGEVVGIIGRNGAGKTTLLKILSRITEPTEGQAESHGRVGSLLEVGTGFHPELTGRENIYLNGAILGMKRVEIDRKFDEIVAFSGIEKFIDTSVKHYSSGMYVRLGFSVAAHLEPEILFVDEVLAVGDTEFQEKCLGKMEDMSGQGRTILFVSHNMGAIRELCQRGIVLEEGQVSFLGRAKEAISYYLDTRQAREQLDRGNLNGCSVEVCGIELQGLENGEITSGSPFVASVEFQIHHTTSSLRLNCVLMDSRRAKIVHLQTTLRELAIEALEPGLYWLQVTLPPLWLAAGAYTLIFVFRELGNPNCERKIESEYLPVTVTGDYSRFSAALAPCAEWQLSSSNR